MRLLCVLRFQKRSEFVKCLLPLLLNDKRDSRNYSMPERQIIDRINIIVASPD